MITKQNQNKNKPLQMVGNIYYENSILVGEIYFWKWELSFSLYYWVSEIVMEKINEKLKEKSPENRN